MLVEVGSKFRKPWYRVSPSTFPDGIRSSHQWGRITENGEGSNYIAESEIYGEVVGKWL